MKTPRWQLKPFCAAARPFFCQSHLTEMIAIQELGGWLRVGNRSEGDRRAKATVKQGAKNYLKATPPFGAI